MDSQLSNYDLDYLIDFEKLRTRKKSWNGYSGRKGLGRTWKTKSNKKKLSESKKRGYNKFKNKSDTFNIKSVNVFVYNKEYLITTHTTVPSNINNVFDLDVLVKFYNLTESITKEIEVPQKYSKTIFFSDIKNKYAKLTNNFNKQHCLKSSLDFSSIISKSISELLEYVQNPKTPLVYSSEELDSSLFWMDSKSGVISKTEHGDICLESSTHYEFLFLPNIRRNKNIFNNFSKSNLVTKLFVAETNVPLDIFYHPVKLPKSYFKKLIISTPDERAEFMMKFEPITSSFINNGLQKEIYSRFKNRYFVYD